MYGKHQTIEDPDTGAPLVSASPVQVRRLQLHVELQQFLLDRLQPLDSAPLCQFRAQLAQHPLDLSDPITFDVAAHRAGRPHTVLASHYEGKELNSPNDVVVHSGGAIYFSDPTYGRAEYYGRPRACELPFRGVYRIDPAAARLTLLADDFLQPNGLCFSADEKRLFVNDTDRQHIRVFDVNPDGTLANSREWAKTVGEGAGAPDGMKLDAESNLYCAGPGGIHVFDPGGTCLGVIRMPEFTANFAWGDADRRTLYVTASTSLYRTRTMVPGRAQSR